jgi:hypothetical protein
MMADGELLIALTFNPNEAANEIAARAPAGTVYSWQFSRRHHRQHPLPGHPVQRQRQRRRTGPRQFPAVTPGAGAQGRHRHWGDPTVLALDKLPAAERAAFHQPANRPGGTDHARSPSRTAAGSTRWSVSGCGATASEPGPRAAARCCWPYRWRCRCCGPQPRQCAPRWTAAAWRELLADPQTVRALAMTLWTGLCATALSVALAAWVLSRSFPGPGLWQRLVQRLPPMLAVPHAALAIGLAFLIAPSGWLLRAVLALGHRL